MAFNNVAVLMGADLSASVAFYGAPPPLEEVPKIKAAVLVHHGSMDTRLAGTWPAYEAALKAAGVQCRGYVYEGAQHGFYNDTTPRYDEAAPNWPGSAPSKSSPRTFGRDVPKPARTSTPCYTAP